MKFIALLIITFSWTLLLAQQNDESETSLDELVTSSPVSEESTAGSNQGQPFKGENVNVRRFNQSKWKEIVGDTDYEERKPATKNDKNKLKEGKGGSEGEKRMQVEEGESSTVSLSVPWGGGFLQIFTYVAIIALVLGFLFIIFRNVSTGSSKIKRPSTDKQIPDHVENIEELEIDRLIRLAREAGNLRLVVRLYFLGLLQKLNEKGMIRWEKDKTNREYLTEIFSREILYEDVKKVTLAYEKVWYGEHAINHESFNTLIGNFEQLNQKLN